MKKLIPLALIILALSLSGCKDESLAADKLTWVGDTPILFVDDFSTQTGGWRTYEDRLSYTGYDLGGFRLTADQPNFLIWSVPGLNFKDILIYTQAQKLDGPNDNLYGLVCRYQNSQNFYAFMISSDGYYGIYRKQAGYMSLMGSTKMGFSEVIQRGDEHNQITAVCRGDQLALIVNDTNLLQVKDSTFTYGDVGMIAGNLAEPGTSILFDYFIVSKP
jgi:hypothetical protein